MDFLVNKHAIVWPILKKSSLDYTVCKNYRQTSLLNLCFKLLKATISSQFSLLIYINIDPLQCEIRPSHSTKSVLLSVFHGIRSLFSFPRSVFLFFLDLSSAFDLVDYYIILDDQSNIGVSFSATSPFHLYFSNRTYSVEFNSSLSDKFPLI